MFAARERPGWDEDVAALCAVVAALLPARTLDVACGTGYLTRHLRGEVARALPVGFTKSFENRRAIVTNAR